VNPVFFVILLCKLINNALYTEFLSSWGRLLGDTIVLYDVCGFVVCLYPLEYRFSVDVIFDCMFVDCLK
jgi:hypothetical protein